MNTGWICPRCSKVHAPTTTTCDCKPEPPARDYSVTITQDGYYMHDCMHEHCPTCGGTGIRKDGLGACIHMISCPCPKCRIT